MFSKLKISSLFLFILLAMSFVFCANDDGNDSPTQTEPEQIILSSSVSTVNESDTSVEFTVSFLHFSTIPSTVDVYLDNDSSAFESNVSVINNKITVNFSSLRLGTYKVYVKSGNISSNFVYITKEGHKYISIRLGKVCNSKGDISSYDLEDFLLDDEVENKNAGVAKGYYYGLQLMAENFSSYSLTLSIEGNNSPDTSIFEIVDNRYYGSFYPLYISPNETAEKITIIASNEYDKTIKGTLTLDLTYNNFNRENFTSELSFNDKIFLTKDDIYYIRDTISENNSIEYNLDFTNCRFEFDKVPNRAFYKGSDNALSNLKKVILPNTIKEIGNSAFEYCNNMTLEQLPESLEIIENYAFRYCNNMKLEQLPENLKKIYSYAFINCESITINRIPDSVTYIGSWAFSGCTGITSIQLPNKLESFYITSFEKCSISEIKIPASVKSIYTGSYEATDYNFVVDNDNNYYKAIDGILYSKDGKTLYRIPVSKVGYSYSIPSSVSKITECALCYLSDLTTLYIPSSVTEMEQDAIVNCMNLQTINIDFSEKPNGWDDDWLWNTNKKTINYTGTSSGNNDDVTESDDSLTGTYTIKDNTSGQLKFSNGVLEFIYTGITRNTYSYEVSNSILTVTLDVSQGNFVGQFDIEKTDTGYVLKQKDDIALSWVGTWTHASSTEKVEIYK